MTDFQLVVSGSDAVPDDVRAAFNELVHSLRNAQPDDGMLDATLIVGAETYTADDVPDDDIRDDAPEPGLFGDGFDSEDDPGFGPDEVLHGGP
jgi:hypothetical protein